ncbi:MAG: DNA primase [Planctomycetota bacterium]
MERGTDQDVVARVKEAVDIIDVIGDRIPLKRRGHSFWAPCPFHQEKTPSFHVRADRQFYHCFGCNAGGDVIRFVQEFDKLTFGEALETLAARAGIQIEKRRPGSGPDTSQSGRLTKVLDFACRFYEKQLTSDTGRVAREYLDGRGLGEDIAQRFRLGYAPPGWDNLLRLATRKGVQPKELEAAGLVTPRQEGSGYYDRFRGRLMFPIFDVTGQRVVGFGARALSSEDNPKYLNSPEGPLFSKRRLLYGLNHARAQFTAEKPPLVVEGYTDVLAAHQAGFGQAVATLGTALTPEHARLLKRYGQAAVLVFDGDTAGVKAAERGSEVFARADLEIRVALLPGGQDPCDLLTKDGGAAEFERETSGASDLIDFLLAQQSSHFDLSSVAGRAGAADALLAIVMEVKEPLRRSLYLQRVAEALHLDEPTLRRRASEAKRAAARRAVSRGEESTEPSVAPPVITVSRRRLRAEGELLEALVHDSSYYRVALEEACRLDLEPLNEQDFHHEPHRGLFAMLRGTLEAGEAVSLEKLVIEDGELWRLVGRLFASSSEEERDLDAQFYGALGRLLLERLEEEYRDLKEKRSEVLGRSVESEVAEYLKATEDIRRRIERFRSEWLGIGSA